MKPSLAGRNDRIEHSLIIDPPGLLGGGREDVLWLEFVPALSLMVASLQLSGIRVGRL